MRRDKVETGPETTDDDRALNAISDAILAGKAVTYRGSLEQFWGARVLWLERCEFHNPNDPWRDCCHRQQAIVGVRVGETQEAELRHVAAFHLIVEPWEVVTCARCGYTGACTPSSDFYTTPLFAGEGRVCEGCFQGLVRNHMGDASA